MCRKAGQTLNNLLRLSVYLDTNFQALMTEFYKIK